VAALLSGAAILLQPAQQRNVKVEKIQDMLESLQTLIQQLQNAEKLYDEHIVREIVINEEGEEIRSL
jgi:Na+-transporting NADH:ubiquinone oxidoreductase subunit NqrC